MKVPAPRPPRRRLLAALLPETVPLELPLLGRTLLHAAIVGAAAGLLGAGFFAGLEATQRLLLEQIAGYVPLRADGERLFAEATPTHFRPWLLALLPALGGLCAGLLARRAPEVRGGGGDQMIEAFHRRGGRTPRTLLWRKAIASMATLGTGGSGGREGPTMQIGGAIGSLVGDLLRVAPRERRILFVAGVAAGMAAVFRTPLGAALLAVEVLYRDDFESEALIPSLLASVVAYSIVITMFGESRLFAHAPHYPFLPSQLPLYALLALVLAAIASLFLNALRLVQSASARLPLPIWARPALGGLLLGALAVPTILYVDARIGAPGHGIGIFGSGYGAVQVAITGADWMPTGWGAVEVLGLLAFAKLCATSLTIGTGGSAGDFAPSLALGGLVGGAFGRAAQLLLHDPSIDPGAFALVGMGTLYGGVAHVPMSALILVCELAGSYDLLVPLMLTEGIAFVALRGRSLYHAQPTTKNDSPTHQLAPRLDVLGAVRVADLVKRDRPFLTFAPSTRLDVLLHRMGEAGWQDSFPIVDDKGAIVGLVSGDMLRVAAGEEAPPWLIAVDLMQPPVTVRLDDDLRVATERMLAHGLREVPVVGPEGAIVGFLDEAEVSQLYLRATRASSPDAPR